MEVCDEEELWLGYQAKTPEELRVLSSVRRSIQERGATVSFLEGVRHEIEQLKREEEAVYNEWWDLHRDEIRLNVLAQTPDEFEELDQTRRLLRQTHERMGILSTVYRELERLKQEEERAKVPVIIRACNSELMQWLAKHPEDLYQVHPGTFEHIVARLFEDEGYEVEILGAWNQADGGVDLIAVRQISRDVNIRLAIQCKRHRRDSKVSAEPIRALAGVLGIFRAHAGVFVTTSYFTRAAEEETRQHLWRISLRDYDRIVLDLKHFGLFERSSGETWVPKSED
jgi:restriction endonuclease Mrr